MALATLMLQTADPARSLAQAMLETVREPLLVLDSKLDILAASRSFHRAFGIGSGERGQNLFGFDNGAWDIPELHVLLEGLPARDLVTHDFALAHEFPRIGLRNLSLHVRMAEESGGGEALILLSVEDVTELRAIEAEKSHLQHRTDQLVEQKEVLLKEMRHRIVNSLQIIAAILMLKARAVTSEEARRHLHDAHRRVISIATVQEHLSASGRADLIDIEPYLAKLCASLAESMVSESRPARIAVVSDPREVPSADAICLGLIVTELVINALKHAFPPHHDGSQVTVRYEAHEPDWKLSVSDNGAGRAEGRGPPPKGGLGTSLVAALADQLDGKVAIKNGPTGMSITVTHATSPA